MPIAVETLHAGSDTGIYVRFVFLLTGLTFLVKMIKKKKKKKAPSGQII